MFGKYACTRKDIGIGNKFYKRLMLKEKNIKLKEEAMKSEVDQMRL